MPIVLSYNDVNALGSLAYNAGNLYGRAGRAQQEAQLLAQIDAQRNQAAVGLQSISAQERQAALDRQQRADLATLDQQFRYDQLAAQDRARQQQTAAQLGQAGIRAQAGLEREAIEGATQAQRDKLLHQQALERIEREAQLGKYSRRSSQDTPPSYQPGTMPSKDYAEQEAQEFGHLIPFDTGQAYSADYAARKRDERVKTAQSMSALPTDQLNAFLNERPNDPWAPYIRAVIQARQTLEGGQRGNVGAMPEGRRVPGQQQRGATQGLRGPGYADPRFEGLSDEEIMRLGHNPALLQQLMGR